MSTAAASRRLPSIAIFPTFSDLDVVAGGGTNILVVCESLFAVTKLYWYVADCQTIV
jgi:hypothetical protein